MPVVRIPHVVVVEAVDVRVELTLGVQAHVRKEEMYSVPSIPPPV